MNTIQKRKSCYNSNKSRINNNKRSKKLINKFVIIIKIYKVY